MATSGSSPTDAALTLGWASGKIGRNTVSRMSYKDRETRLQGQRQRYRDRLEVLGNAPRRESKRLIIRSLKHQRSCADCGVAYPWYVMEFDHPFDPKARMLNRLAHRKARHDVIVAEIKKYDVVCRNCLAEREHRRRPPNQRPRVLRLVGDRVRWAIPSKGTDHDLGGGPHSGPKNRGKTDGVARETGATRDPGETPAKPPPPGRGHVGPEHAPDGDTALGNGDDWLGVGADRFEVVEDMPTQCPACDGKGWRSVRYQEEPVQCGPCEGTGMLGRSA
jgi:hypothetical protein